MVQVLAEEGLIKSPIELTKSRGSSRDSVGHCCRCGISSRLLSPVADATFTTSHGLADDLRLSLSPLSLTWMTSMHCKVSRSDLYHGHEHSSKLCARFISHLFACPPLPLHHLPLPKPGSRTILLLMPFTAHGCTHP
jgi:hypothetical protein